MFGLGCTLMRIGMNISLRIRNMYIHRKQGNTLVLPKEDILVTCYRRMLDIDSHPVEAITLNHHLLPGRKPAVREVRLTMYTRVLRVQTAR